MNKQLLTGAIATATLTLTSIVLAAPARALTFDLGRPSGRLLAPSIDFAAQDGINLRATVDSNSSNSALQVFQNRFGLGATIALDSSDGDANQVDGRGDAESLILTFSERVNLSAATFSAIQNNDQFQLFVDGNSVSNFDIPGVGDGLRVDFAPVLTGSVFRFFASERNDDFFLSSVDVTAVPTPAAVLPGLMSLGVAVARKKRNAEENNQEA